jgi:hypothetical protein
MSVTRPTQQSVEWLAFGMEEAWSTLRERLEGLTDGGFFMILIHHDAHHGVEISCLRDLYRAMRR